MTDEELIGRLENIRKNLTMGLGTDVPKATSDLASLTQLIADVRRGLTGDEEFDKILWDCITTLDSKGQEYTIGSKDRLANFKSVAEAISSAEIPLEMQHIWFTYFYKHYSAIVSYIKNGCQVKSNETIQSRIIDCIVYLMLFNKMTLEIERKRVEDLVPF